MRDEFLHAAELYLDCNRPTKAAICLQNAREKELSAQLFEKLGQVCLYYAPSLKKLMGHIALGLSVRPSVCVSVTKSKLQF